MSEDNLRIVHLSQESAKQKIKEHGSERKASKATGIPKTTLRRWASGEVSKGVRRFIITYAQNNTPVHSGFYMALQQYMSMWNAELICYRGRYRNPTSIKEEEKKKYTEWWDDRITPYLMEAKRDINPNLMIFPAHTQPTAVKPLSGFDTHTGSMSGIFPHPKIHLRTVPTPGNKIPKILTTTGAITMKNYSASKAGEKGKHHHQIGAVIVEIDEGESFHIRHIQAEDDGSFYDIAGGECRKYTPKGIGVNKERIETLVMGDIHFPWIDYSVVEATKNLMSDLNPENVFIHDLIDFWAKNHHEVNNRFLNAAKEKHGLIDVQKEMKYAADFLASLCDIDRNTYVVRSNHDEALDKWLNIEDVNKLGLNAEYFHWLSYHKHKSAKKSFNGFHFQDMLEFAIKEHLNLSAHKLQFIKRDEFKIINGIDYSMHGDVGPSGARGSSTNLSKIGVKSVIGHAHSPSIVNGCYQVGVKCVIPLGYSRGPSAWIHTDCITYKNGKRTLINYIGGKYCNKEERPKEPILRDKAGGV